jgi:DNA-directed RNA polymerase specialized sigma24 family protein
VTDAAPTEAPPEPADDRKAELLAELQFMRPERARAQAVLDAIDGRRWDVFTELRALGAKHREIAEAWGVSEPAVIQTLKKPRPVPAAER